MLARIAYVGTHTTLNGTFGEITGTGPALALGSGSGSNDPRIAQFSLKLNF